MPGIDLTVSEACNQVERSSGALACPAPFLLLYDKKVLSMIKMSRMQHFERKRGLRHGRRVDDHDRGHYPAISAMASILLTVRTVAAEVEGAGGDLCVTVDRSIRHGQPQPHLPPRRY